MNNSNNPRDRQLMAWLEGLAHTHQLQLDTMAPASSDASFRRYFRLQGGPAADSGSVIVMDAPPPHEDCHPFIDVGQRLHKAGLNVPQVLAQNLQEGFLLLSDLGPATYLNAIHNDLPENQRQPLYLDAINALVNMQQADTSGLPAYTQHWLVDELSLFPQWYVHHHCQTSLSSSESAMLAHTFNVLAADNMRQPFVLVHRDFHSPNLMLITDSKYGSNPGIIDYQDALLGPISYDLASLVMDARTTWEEDQQLDWAVRYWEAARAAGLPVPDDFAQFHRDYEWMSLQRNLRILGVFARLAYRDNKRRYLEHIPRVNAYIHQVATRYSQFFPLARLLIRLDALQP